MAEKNLEFGKRLDRYIAEAALNKKKLADAIGVSPSAIGAYINEGRIPEAPILFKIAQTLNKTMEALLIGEESVNEKTPIGMVCESHRTYTAETFSDARLVALIEKLTVIYHEGTDIQRAALRGLLDNMLDDLSDILKKKREASTEEPVGAVEKKT